MSSCLLNSYCPAIPSCRVYPVSPICQLPLSLPRTSLNASALALVALSDHPRPFISGRHRDELHADMVRGLAWAPASDTLYSCGWDHAVLSRPVG